MFDQAPFIEKSIKDLTTEGLLGLGFAVAVILVFLMSVRSTLVTAVSIPLSLLITFIGLSATGYSLNILTLGALTIAIGRVVDDSIVVIENIKRHLSYGEDKVAAILTAIREVAGAITASTLTTVAVFLPIAFVGELAGELFRPFALTVTIALLASLLVSLTIVPVLAYWFLKTPAAAAAGSRRGREAAAARRGAKAQEAEQRSRLQRGYLPILSKTQKHPVVTLVAAVLVLGGTAAMTPLLATDLLGDSGQNSMTVRQVLPAGTSLADTSAAAVRLEEVLRGIDGIKDVQVTSGNAQAGFAALTSTGASNSTFTVVTEEKADQARLQETVRTELAKVGRSGQDLRRHPAGRLRHVLHGGHHPQGRQLRRTSATASDAMVQAMTGVPGSQRGGHQPRGQPARGPGQGGPGQGRGRRPERGTGGRRPGRHHQPHPGRDRADRHQRLPRPDRRGHPLHQHRRRPQHPAAGAGRTGDRWAASPPWSRWTSRSPSPPATASGPRKCPSRRRAPTWAR